MSITRSDFPSCPSSVQTGQQGGKRAAAKQQGSGPRPAEARKETLVMLEDAEIDWDVADIQKVQQRAKVVTGASLHPSFWK